jgi:hypothetical protein
MIKKTFLSAIIMIGCYFIFPFIAIMIILFLQHIFFLLTNWGVQEKAISPNGKYIAESYIVNNGGATVSYAVQVSLRKPYTIRFSRRGNIFRGYRSQYIDIEWKDENTLIIIMTVRLKTYLNR